ncbi:MAG: PQQ-binding-like beta-propeller repeat protein [Bacteroidota bacterium]
MKRNIHHSCSPLRLLLWVVLLIALGSPALHAQGWEKNYGGPWQDLGYAVAPSPNGGYVAVGSSNSFTAGDNDVYVIKIDSVGNEVWTRTYGGPAIDEGYFIEAINGGYIIGGNTGGITNGHIDSYLMRIDEVGDEVWSQSYEDSTSQDLLDMILTADGSIVICSYGSSLSTVRKVDQAGNTLWTKNYEDLDTLNFSRSFSLAAVPNNDIAMVLNDDTGNFILLLAPDGSERWRRPITLVNGGFGSNLTVTADGGFLITESRAGMIRLDAMGNFLWDRPYPIPGETSLFGTTALLTADGGFLLSGRQLFKTDSLGNLEWLLDLRADNTLLSRAYQAIPSTDNGYLVVGRSREALNVDTDLVLLKIDQNGNLFSHFITGQIFLDTLNNCTKDVEEPALRQWIVRAEGAEGTLYGVSDAEGQYAISLDTGTYEVTVISPSPYLDACTPATTVQVNTDTIQIDQAIEALVDCPYLTVNISTNFLRRCFTSRYYVDYCNKGSSPADDAYIILELDDSLRMQTAALPFVEESDNVFRFDLGELPTGFCDKFWVDVEVSCSSAFGQAHCSSVHIYPDSLCGAISSTWSGASVFVEGSCDGDSTRFKIRNIGSGNMDSPLNYIVIEDVVMYMTQPFSLDSGDSLSLAFPANGSTYQLRAEQVAGHPGSLQPFAFVEGCGTNNAGSFSTGFVNMFGMNDGDSFLDIDCRSNIGSYDPNDKQGFPRGFGDDHLIEANTAIDYLIRFQNTGTDTAFTVVIKDTLSPHLDLESFELGTFSHPVELSIIADNILQFTFNNIHLPDSNVNEPASHGFVRFRIAQKPDLNDGTIIHNQAAIYFDFNEPIITNRTRHEIGTQFLQLVPTLNQDIPPTKIYSFPNPMHNSSNIVVEGYENQNLDFKLFDVQGREVYRKNFDGGQLLFYRNQLHSGPYFYLIEQSGQPLSSGKLIIH